MFWKKIIIGSTIFILGNILYSLSKLQLKPLDISIVPYTILVVTYVCIGLLLCTTHTTKKLLYLFDLGLILLVLLPIAFPFLTISFYILDTSSYIFLSLMLGYSIKATFHKQP